MGIFEKEFLESLKKGHIARSICFLVFADWTSIEELYKIDQEFRMSQSVFTLLEINRDGS